MNALPDFFIAGAPRCGTTSLYAFLRSHPDVYMPPVKEPHYFAMGDIRPDLFRIPIQRDLAGFDFDSWLAKDNKPLIHRWYVDDWNTYMSLFSGKRTEHLGEASTSYLWAPHAAARIREKVPGARIIICMRHPVERAFSHYLMERRMGLTRKPFHAHLAEDLEHPVRSWGATSLYVELGMYYQQASRYIELFGRDRVHFCLLDDMKSDETKTHLELLQFLGLSGHSIPLADRHQNRSLRSRIPVLERLSGQPRLRAAVRKLTGGRGETAKRWIYSKKITEQPGEKERELLLRKFSEDTRKLQDLVGRDLSSWLV